MDDVAHWRELVEHEYCEAGGARRGPNGAVESPWEWASDLRTGRSDIILSTLF